MILSTPPRPESTRDLLTVPPLRPHPTWHEKGVPDFLPLDPTSPCINPPLGDAGRQTYVFVSSKGNCQLPLIPHFLPNKERPIYEYNGEDAKFSSITRKNKPAMKFRLRPQYSRYLFPAVSPKEQERTKRRINPSQTRMIAS